MTKLARMELLFNKDNASLRDAPFVTIAEFMELRAIEAKLILVDIRPPEEHLISMIPEAVTGTAFEAAAESYLQHTVISYCTIGGRSGRYTEELRKRGFRALNLKFSVLGWAHAGGTFIGSDGQSTRRVHVSGRKWNLLPDGYEGVW